MKKVTLNIIQLPKYWSLVWFHSFQKRIDDWNSFLYPYIYVGYIQQKLSSIFANNILFIFFSIFFVYVFFYRYWKMYLLLLLIPKGVFKLLHYWHLPWDITTNICLYLLLWCCWCCCFSLLLTLYFCCCLLFLCFTIIDLWMK